MNQFSKKQKGILIAVICAVLAVSVFLGYGLGSGGLFKKQGEDKENPLSMSYDDSREKDGKSGIVKITATCESSVKEGQDIPADQIKVMRVYADGTEKEITNFTYDASNLSAGGTDGTVYTPYGAVALEVNHVSITGLKTTKSYYAGQIPDGNGVVAVYADGSEENVDSNSIDMSPVTLVVGLNEVPVKVNGHDHTLYINASSSTYAQRAASSDTSHRTRRIEEATLFAGLSSFDAYDLVHICINNPSQITTASTEKGVGVLTGATTNGGVVISNGQITGGDTTTGHEICITSTGGIFSPGAGYAGGDLISQGCVASILTDAPVLIYNSMPLVEGQSDAVYYNAVGMVSPGDYYVLSSSTGLTCAGMQQVFRAAGCSYARPLTGSASLLWNGEALLGSATSGSGIMFNQ
ncbi:MAG: hypothetical protein VZR02_06670 [Lachnospiraceae bacterium]|nr:hypothetical protein [Lachnospiraceae bacterium]